MYPLPSFSHALQWLFWAAALVQLVYWIVVLRGAFKNGFPATLRRVPPGKTYPPVSLIVCFRNEAENLERLLPKLLEQTYPGPVELILVDDNSTDQSASVVHPYTIREANVRLLDPGPTRPGKKDALTYGIHAASHEHLLLTDADCLPASSHWLWLMTEPLRTGRELTLGVSPYFADRAGGALAAWQRFEAFYVALKYLGFARRNQPYMGVGRNLAYTKAFFRRAGEFTGHADLPSGDDDLLVAGTADPATTARVVDPAAWALSWPQTTWRAYFRQRRRHQSTGGHYPGGVASNLGLIGLSHGLFYLLGLAILFTAAAFVGVLLYVVRILILWAAYAPLYAARPGEGLQQPSFSVRLRYLPTVMFFDALVGPMYLYLAISGVFGARHW